MFHTLPYVLAIFASVPILHVVQAAGEFTVSADMMERINASAFLAMVAVGVEDAGALESTVEAEGFELYGAPFEDYEVEFLGFEFPEPHKAIIAAKDGRCYGVFRGTIDWEKALAGDRAAIRDWLYNVDVASQTVCTWNTLPTTCCEAHRGFYRSYFVRFREEFETQIRQCLAVNGFGSELILAGHSQGGAIANIASFSLADRSPYVITFGAPAVFLHGECDIPDSVLDRSYRFSNINGNTHLGKETAVYDPVPWFGNVAATVILPTPWRFPGWKEFLGLTHVGHHFVLGATGGAAYMGRNTQSTTFFPIDKTVKAHFGYEARIKGLIAETGGSFNAVGFPNGGLCTMSSECQSGNCRYIGSLDRRCVGEVETETTMKVIHIGDSFSSGVGAGGGLNGPQGCYRSKASWGAQYANWLQTNLGIKLTYTNRACAGSEIRHLDESRHTVDTKEACAFRSQSECNDLVNQGERCATTAPDETRTFQYDNGGIFGTAFITCQRSVRPQLESVDSDANLILLTFGFGDLDLFDAAEKCFDSSGSASSCQDALGDAKSKITNGEIKSLLKELLLDIHDKASGATVVLIGYPHMATSVPWTRKLCFKIDIARKLLVLPVIPTPIDQNEWNLACDNFVGYDVSSAFREVSSLLDTAQSEAVQEANAASADDFAVFVSVQDEFASHEQDPSLSLLRDTVYRNLAWLGYYGFWLYGEKTTGEDIEKYHLNPEGHKQLAQILQTLYTFNAATKAAIAQSTSIDIVFVVDYSGSMSGAISEARRNMKTVLSELTENAKDFRVGIVKFAGRNGQHPADVVTRVLNFTSDEALIQQKIDSVRAASLGFEPTWSALMEAYSMNWRAGVKKVVLLFGDEPPPNPEPNTGLVVQDVIDASLRIDPVAVYSIDTGSMANGGYITKLAEQTGGAVLTRSQSSNVGALINEIVETATRAPFAWIGDSYGGLVGDLIEFDASGSYAINGSIATFEWDMDADGFYDAVTNESRYEYVYGEPYSGLVSVRVTDDGGRASLASAFVLVVEDTDQDGIIDTLDNCPDTPNQSQADSDSNGLGDACDPDFEPLYPEVSTAGPFLGQAGLPINISGAVLEYSTATAFATGWTILEGNCTIGSPTLLTTTVECQFPGIYEIILVATLDDVAVTSNYVYSNALVFVEEASALPSTAPSASTNEPTKSKKRNKKKTKKKKKDQQQQQKQQEKTNKKGKKGKKL